MPSGWRIQDGTLTKAANQIALSSTTYFAGSGGMVTTAEDYAQFAQMLVNGGELNGRRSLGKRTVQLMSTNHTGDLVYGQLGRPAAGHRMTSPRSPGPVTVPGRAVGGR